ncbi:MAG: hypothetical protein FWD13_09085 [Treponema sp.]|nr:hypothetical protein [Treponema sp.]
MKRVLIFSIVFYVIVFSIYAQQPGEVGSTESATLAFWDRIGIEYTKTTRGTLNNYTWSEPEGNVLFIAEYGFIVYFQIVFNNERDIMNEYEQTARRRRPDDRIGNVHIWYTFSNVRLINIENRWDAFMTNDYFHKYIRSSLR